MLKNYFIQFYMFLNYFYPIFVVFLSYFLYFISLFNSDFTELIFHGVNFLKALIYQKTAIIIVFHIQ